MQGLEFSSCFTGNKIQKSSFQKLEWRWRKQPEGLTQEHSPCGTDSEEPTWLQMSKVRVSLRVNCHLLRYWTRVIVTAIALGGVITPSSQKLELKKPLPFQFHFYLYYLFLSRCQTLCLAPSQILPWYYLELSTIYSASLPAHCFFRKSQINVLQTW